MGRGENDSLRRQLIDVVQATSDDMCHPWYALRPGRHPERLDDETTDEIATVAIRRWRSAERRTGGRRDRTADLAKGLHEHFAEIDWPGARDDFQFLAAQLAKVFQQARSEDE